jgi:hypothetical protein
MCTLKYILHSTSKSNPRACFQLKNYLFPPPTTKKLFEIKTNNDTKYRPRFSWGSSAYTQISTKTAPNDKGNMGLGSMNMKQKFAEVCNSKIVKDKRNQGKENDQRCKGEEGQVLNF